MFKLHNCVVYGDSQIFILDTSTRSMEFIFNELKNLASLEHINHRPTGMDADGSTKLTHRFAHRLVMSFRK